MIRQALVHVMLASALLVSTGCCKGSHLDDAKIEALIKAELAAKGITMKSVDCPPDRPLKKGDEFTCSGVDSENEALVFRVDQTDEHGTISWKMDGMIINQKKIGDSIESKMGKAADVECPQKSLVMKVGSSFTCDVTVDGKKEHVVLTLTNATGDVSWKLAP